MVNGGSSPADQLNRNAQPKPGFGISGQVDFVVELGLGPVVGDS
jgi:hypothetical protein